MMSAISNVLVVDDHPMFRAALSTAVKLAHPASNCTESASIDEAIQLLGEAVTFDIALVDLKIPGVSGFDGLLRIRSLYPRLPVLVVSGLDCKRIVDESIMLGAAGFLPKSLDQGELVSAMDVVMQGDVFLPDKYRAENLSDNTSGHEENAELGMAERVASLTPQQLRVLTMLQEGLLNKQIAYELGVGSSTIKKHVSEILRKLKVNSRTQAVIEVSKIDQQTVFDTEGFF